MRVFRRPASAATMRSRALREQPPMDAQRHLDGIDVARRFGLDRLGAGGDGGRVIEIGRAAQRGLVLHEFGERGGRPFRAGGVHGIEPGKQPPDETGPLPCRQRAVELADGGRRGIENIEDVLDGWETGSGRPEATASLGVQFNKAGVQLVGPITIDYKYNL